MPKTQIVPFAAPSHLDAAVAALLNVRVADPTYPPPRDADANPDSFAAWLMEEEVLGRWVSLIDGQVAGHIAITKAHPYLTGSLTTLGYESPAGHEFCEVSKFFVDPDYQGHGVGADLFKAAFEFAWSIGRQPALAVISSSSTARRFYTRKGMLEVGSFFGVHGQNFVFVDDATQFSESAMAPRAPGAAA